MQNHDNHQAGQDARAHEVVTSDAEPVALLDNELTERDRDLWATYYALVRGC